MTRRQGIAFAVLCLLGGSAWLFDQEFAPALTGLARLAAHDLLLAAIFAGLSRGRRLRAPWWKVAAGGAGMIALPEVLFAGSAAHVAGVMQVLVLLLAPVAVVVAQAQRSAGFGPGENPLGWMTPALAGLAGAVIVLGYQTPPSTAGRLWLAALALSAVTSGLAAVWLHDVLRETEAMPAAAVVAASCGVVAAAFCWLDWSGAAGWSAAAALVEVGRAAGIEGPVIWLTVWLLRRMQPVALSARLLVIPLVSVVESYLLVRPGIGWSSVVGVALMAGGSWGLMRGAGVEEGLSAPL
jgi:drug/metabolite transporter (DMT)-like permease